MTAHSDAKTAKHKTPGPKRFGKGFAQTGGLVSDQIRHVTEKRGFAQAKLLTQWPEIAGESLAKITRPVKVSYSREGFGATLTILAQSAHAPEIQMMLPQLQEKVNTCYGYSAISRIRITQTAETGFAEGQADFTYDKPVKQITNENAQALKRDVSTIADTGLRDALERLGKNILTR